MRGLTKGERDLIKWIRENKIRSYYFYQHVEGLNGHHIGDKCWNKCVESMCCFDSRFFNKEENK